MPDNQHYDIMIIGTGAGGGTLAARLAPAGKKILLLERGDFVKSEKANWDSRTVNVEAKYHTKEVWRDKDGEALHPHTNYYVGGNTKFYGAALFHFRQEDFGVLRHRDGLSPAWPLTYDDLEPDYTQDPAVSHEPRMQQLHEDFARLGCQPFNLYVVDGSFFVSSAAVNPALTMMANALRVGDHLLERMK